MEQISQKIQQFRAARHWTDSDTERNLAISISLEAAELLEIYQWQDSVEDEQTLEHVKEEVADVLIYALSFCQHLNLDPQQIIEDKLIKNAVRYPRK